MSTSRQPPRLQPPPRVPAADHGAAAEPAERGSPHPPHLLRRLGVVVVLFTLVLGLFGVFVVLPRWQAARMDPAGRNSFAPTPQPPVAPPHSTTPATRNTPLATPSAPTPTIPPPATTADMFSPASAAPPQPTPDLEFNRAMSAALRALDNADWESARVSLETATRLRPGSREVADALTRLTAGKRRHELRARIRDAEVLEQDEAWRAAENAYRSILAIDPESAAALAGVNRTAARAELDETLDFHLQNRGRLSSPAVLADAEEALDRAAAVDRPGPRLASQMTRLEALIRTASTPVTVVLESDNETEVLVLRVGRLGTFFHRELELRPGTYTAVGSRDGFRDVRIRFEVTPGQPTGTVIIRCSETL